MSLLRFSFITLVFAMPFAAAQEPDTINGSDYAKLPVCRLGPDGRSLAVEPCRTAPAQRPMPRRPVPQQRDDTPRIGIPDTTPRAAPAPLVLPSARLEPRSPYLAAPAAPVPPVVNPQSQPFANPAPGAFAAPPPGPSRPQAATCSAGTCRDANGTIYNGSGTVISPTGRMCSSAGGFVTCQ